MNAFHVRHILRFVNAALFFTVFQWLPAQAAPPATLHYQGYLTNASGTPVNSALTAIRFNIYDQAGTQLYSESVVIPITNGQFSATIGNQVALTLPFDQPYFLGIKVGGDPEMSPRIAIASTAYAFRASNASSASIPAVPGTSNNVLVGNAGTASWSNSPILSNLSLASTLTLTQSSKIDMEGVSTFMHVSGGATNIMLGANSGNLTIAGTNNSAFGYSAMRNTTSGASNLAAGAEALFANTTGNNNVAVGRSALENNDTGNGNTALGDSALIGNTSGSNNIGIGALGGRFLTTGSNNIAIGNTGAPAESGTIRLGTAGVHTRTFVAGIQGVSVSNGREILIDSAGQLGSGARMQRGETSVGGGAAGVNVYTVNFPAAFSVQPRIMVTPKFDLFGGNEISDTVAVTVRAVSTTQFKVNVYRVDQAGGAWSANLRLEWQAWE